VNEEDKEFESSSLKIQWLQRSLSGGWSSNRIKEVVFVIELTLIQKGNDWKRFLQVARHFCRTLFDVVKTLYWLSFWYNGI